MGRAAEAESTFRAVLLEHPHDVDAAIGLGTALTRGNRTTEAIAVLEATRADAGENADFFAALARAYRHEGRPREARDLFVEAHRLAPDDPDILDGLEAVRRTYDHFVGFEGYVETMPEDGGNSGDGTLTLSLRASDRLRFDGVARLRSRDGGTDSLFGAARGRGKGTVPRQPRSAVSNQSLPILSVSTDLTQHSGPELGGGVRLLHFDDGRDGTFRDRRLGYRRPLAPGRAVHVLTSSFEPSGGRSATIDPAVGPAPPVAARLDHGLLRARPRADVLTADRVGS
jgi:hypothetical protein